MIDKSKSIAVLLGGKSAEREVSLNTGAGCARALRERGYAVTEVDVGDDVAARLAELAPAAAFIALHGRWGEDGCIQGLLECMGIPYTGSGVLASAMAFDKVASKHLFSMVGVPTPEYKVVPRARAAGLGVHEVPFGLPLVVKPACEGSSVGVTIVRDADQFRPAVDEALKYAGDVLVERFIAGKEISVAVLDDEALGAIEIEPARAFYDYVAKYDKTAGTRYHFPAPVPDATTERLFALSIRAHQALGCSGITRADFMLSRAGEPWLIEINTLPGLTETSLVPKIAAGCGIDYPELCDRLIQGASLKA